MRGFVCFLLGALLLVAHCEEESDVLGHFEDDNETDVVPDTHGGVPTNEGNEEEEEGDTGDEEEEESVWTDEQVSSGSIREMHKKIDANSDGKISKDEVHAFSKTARQSINTKESLVTFEGMDENKDGKISLEELMDNHFGSDAPEPEGVAKTPEQEAEDAGMAKMKELEKKKFKVADKNGDGSLDKDELPGILYPESHDGVLHLTAEESLKAKDKDGDGELSQEEFWAHETDEQDNEAIRAEQHNDFEKLDADKNGKLNLEELKHWESGAYHSHDAFEQLFEIADEDGDSHLSAVELDNSREPMANTMASSHFAEWVEHYEL